MAGPLPLQPVDPEDDLTRLKTDLVENGADVEAVNLCDEIFKDGISKEALQKPLTCKHHPGNDAVLYKNHRDALRHFHKDHFGLWFECTLW